MTDLLKDLAAFAEAVERTAFQMPAPNPWTPVFVSMAQQAAMLIRTHAAEIEAMAMDAHRYRWLRNVDSHDGFWIAHGDIGNLSQWTGSHADQEIDAAMRSAKEDGDE